MIQVLHVNRQHQLRAAVEHFICDKYWLSFRACVTQLPERLLALTDPAGTLVAACALTPAASQVVFSERYLAHPAELLLSQHFATNIVRSQFAEVGALACRNFSYLPILFAAIVDTARNDGFEYLLFTATQQLQRHLVRFQLPTVRLGEAPDVALPDKERPLWGDYYQHHPVVLAGQTNDGLPLLDSVFYTRHAGNDNS